MGEEEHDASAHNPVHHALSSSTIQSVAETAWSAPPPPLAATNMAGTMPPPTTANGERRWNTQSLGLRMGVDLMAAGSAAVLIAPVITMIDKSIMENASGRNSLSESLKASAKELLLRPHRFLGQKAFALVFCTYGTTYLTANLIDTTHSTLHATPASTVTAGTSKFVATSAANLSISLYKDKRFTQLFGVGGPARPVPLPTFALFTVRDCLTIFASFNLPPLIAPRLAARMGDDVQRYVGALSVAQFVTPAALQLFSTPLHLLGLDLYNRPGVGVGGPEGRAARVLRDWVKASFARMGRIVPAFGVGGVVNTKVRRRFMEGLE